MENQTDIFNAGKKDRLFMQIFLFVLAVLWLIPIYSVLNNSLKVGGFNNYIYVITHPVQDVAFGFYFLNSLIVAAGSSFTVIAVCTLAGFAFSKIKFRGRNVIYNSVLMCLAVSGPIILVPVFFILKSMHLYNTYLAIILPQAVITIPFGVLMMKNFYDNLPVTIMESAYIDGATIGRIFTDIFFPLAKPAVINLGVLQIMWSFQEFLFPLMYLTKPKLYTATVAINSFRGVYGIAGQNLGRYNAALVLIGVPAIIVFVLAQKYIIRGITSGAIKD